MILRLLLVGLLGIVLQYTVRIIYEFDFHVTVYTHFPGRCRLVPGIDFGTEDLSTLSNGLAFISSGLILRNPGSQIRDLCRQNNVTAHIYLFDFNNPDKGVTDLEFSPHFDREDFIPHGLSVWQDGNTGKVSLFVVNHARSGDRVERFEFQQQNNRLLHIRSYQGPGMHIVNDVTATGEDTFYCTICNYYTSVLGQLAETFLFLQTGSVLYYDGKQFSTVADGLVSPNGIMAAPNGRYIYVTVMLSKNINIYEVLENGQLSLKQDFPLYSKPDNVELDPVSGNLLVGVHPSFFQFLKHFTDGTSPAPSKVLMVHLTDPGTADHITEVFADEGRVLYGASVASRYKDQLLIGTVYHKLMYCDNIII